MDGLEDLIEEFNNKKESIWYESYGSDDYSEGFADALTFVVEKLYEFMDDFENS